MNNLAEAEAYEDSADPAELMLRYKQTGDLEIRNQLVMHYLGSVKKQL